jgi:pyruvate,water dikinase
MTSPAWTPLFATAAAVVADAGGALSHTAIVAREYGIPCVVATRTACRDLRTGDWLEVDGNAGEVRRVRSP